MKKFGTIFLLFAIALSFGTGFYIGQNRTETPIQGVANQEVGKPSDVDFSLFWDAWKALQEKYIELQILKQQVSSLIEQKHAIDERENELNVTLAALRKLDTVKKGDEMWSSIGSGAFVRSPR